MAGPSFFAKDPSKLSKAALIEIVSYAQGGLYWDMDDRGEFWNRDKEVGGSDFIEHIARILDKHGLTPVEGPKEWRPKR